MPTKRDQTIDHIVTCLGLYDAHAPDAELRAQVSRLDPESLGVLHGITGVLRHALSAKMPKKWLAQIHGDLLEAFACLAEIESAQN